MRRVISQVNGVFLTGGAIHYRIKSDNSISNVGHAIRNIWDLVLEANANGIYTPLFGTCMGFEMIHAMLVDDNVLLNHYAKFEQLPMNLLPAAKDSRLFSLI